MPAPKELQELVERFSQHVDDYKNGRYNETQVRRDFIDPFFKLLGWDVSNEGGIAEAYRDVIHEDAIKIGGSTKAPDYCLRIGGTRKFFVEAKKPSVDIKGEPAPAFQLRRYAWSAKLPLSILTDFEEFAVYDTRVRPSPVDMASTARIHYWTYKDYSSKWDEIAAVFSKESVLKGSFDKYAASTKGKKGTAEVDTAFLDEIETWRELLAKNIALRNEELSQQALNFAVQQTIDRIIFLRICEDRGIEPYGQLQALVNGNNVYKRLTEIFHKADQRYNSGLFHFREEKDRSESPDKLTLKLDIDDKSLKEIFHHLYYPDSPYEFSVLGADILGSVYERFLGKIIRLTEGHHAKIEEKPEVKKAGGVYYTPTYIVDYIVKHTVGKLLEGKTPKDAEKLRILDPACGSGSFLIGAYQYLLDWHRDWYVQDGAEKHAKGKNPKLWRGRGGEWRLTTTERKRILVSNLYGVDIDSQAVEVTKLSLLLKVLEGESDQTPQSTLFHERVLPDLGSNIKCGNSLIGIDFYQTGLFAHLSDEEMCRVNAFDWEKEFSTIKKAGGFDVVIGNPPYGADYDESQKNYFQSRYDYKKGKPETYIYFTEQGLSLLKDGGVLGYITPNAWLTNHYGIQLRSILLDKTTLLDLVDLEPTRVFEGAVVDTAIAILQKGRSLNGVTATKVWRGTKDRQILHQFEISQKVWDKDDQKIINLQANPTEVKLLSRLDTSSLRLDSIVEYSQGVIPYKTKEDGAANRYISQSPQGQGWLPLIESASQVRRYEIDSPLSFIKYGNWLWCARESRFFTEPKILFHRLRKKLPVQLVGVLDESGAINRHSLSNFILRPNLPAATLYAVLGLFNSRLANWWFVKRYGVLMEVGGFKVCGLPLPEMWSSGASSLGNQAVTMIALHKQLAAASTPHEQENLKRQIDATDRQIDKLVYELYGLTDEETKIVEGEA